MNLKRGVWFAGELPVQRMLALAETADKSGIDSIWVAEGYYGRDAFTSLAAIAAVTTEVQLATGVVNPYSRHPTLLAMSFATLDEIAGGRAVMGIGSGPKEQLEGGMGYDLSKPLTAVSEAVEIIQGMLTGRPVNFAGKVFQAARAQLAFHPVRPQVPLYLAAIGPRMCRLAGRVANGVYLPQTSPLYVKQAVGWVHEGSVEAAREPTAVDIAAEIIMSVAEETEEARRAVRPLLGMLMIMPEAELILDKNDLDPSRASIMREAMASGGIKALAAAVSDAMISRLTIAGTPRECQNGLDEIVASGINYPVVSLIGRNADAALTLISRFGR